jgi:hypothetical protein
MWQGQIGFGRGLGEGMEGKLGWEGGFGGRVEDLVGREVGKRRIERRKIILAGRDENDRGGMGTGCGGIWVGCAFGGLKMRDWREGEFIVLGFEMGGE